MNHVPDGVRVARGELGHGLVADDSTTVDKRLRRDVRLQIACDRAFFDGGTVHTAFRYRQNASR